MLFVMQEVMLRLWREPYRRDPVRLAMLLCVVVVAQMQQQKTG